MPDCIESVEEQTLSDWELVVTDDCSTDGTADVVGPYARRDPRIRYIRNERRLGMSANLKRAADTGDGPYLKILCADDWLAPRCLEVLCELMEQYPRVALATSAEINCNAAGVPSAVQFLFGAALSVVPGETMLDRMARGSGFGGNSSFFIRASAYRAVGGFDGTVPYAPDYDLAARLCRVGDYLHTDEPLFYGRVHSEASSAQNPRRLVDVPDWFEIPERIFRPRRAGNREWRRYQRLTAHLTARYLLNIALEHLRGHHTYARGLTEIVFRHGNLRFGIAALPAHLPARLWRRLTGRNRPAALPPQPWMGAPSARRGAATSPMTTSDTTAG